MDEKTAIDRISFLEDKVRLLSEDIINLETAIVNYRALIDQIPRKYPGGDLKGLDMTPWDWLEWAKHSLGYYDAD